MSPRLDEVERAYRALARSHEGLLFEVNELQRRLDSSMRHGPVTDVDTSKQLARIEIGRDADGGVQKSDWVPYAQFAGTGTGGDDDETKFHCPPVVGQQLTMLAPNGELRQAVLLPFTWSAGATSPADGVDPVFKRGKLKITYEKTRYDIALGQSEIEVKEDQVTAKVGAAVFEIHADFIRGQIGDSRLVVTGDVAKIRKGDQFFVATAAGLFVSEPPVVGTDPDGH